MHKKFSERVVIDVEKPDQVDVLTTNSRQNIFWRQGKNGVLLTILYQKMKNAFLIFCYIAFCSLISAQTFSVDFDIDDREDNGWAVRVIGDEILLLTGSRCQEAETCKGVVKTDLNGNEIWSLQLDHYGGRSDQLMQIKDDKIYFNLFDDRDPSRNALRVIVYDLEKNHINTWKYGADFERLNPTSITFFENDILLNNTDGVNGNFYGHLIFVDSIFNIKRSFRYTDAKWLFFAWDIYVDEDKDIVISYVSEADSRAPREALLLKIDSLGNKIWEKNLGFTFGVYQHTRMTPLQDGGFAYSWVKDLIFRPDTANWPAFVTGLDKDGEVQWEYVFNDTSDKSISHLFTAENGDIIGTGVYEDLNNGPINTGGWIFRMSPSGELLWERRIRDRRYLDVRSQGLNTGAELPNGDLVFSGLIFDTTSSNVNGFSGNAWLLRLGPDGCFEPGCDGQEVLTAITEVKQKKPSSKFRLFPNPASERIMLSASDPIIQQELRVQLYSLTGQLIQSHDLTFTGQTELDVGHLESGVYLLSLLNEWGDTETLKLIKL